MVSSIPYQILLELGVPSTSAAVVTITQDDMKNNLSFRKISPRGVLPVLALPCGESIVEAGAIALYFLEKFDTSGKLHPLPGTPDRPRFLQSVVYTAAEGYSAVVQLFKACRGVPHEKRDRAVVDPRLEKYNKTVVQHLEQQLDYGRRDYYLGAEFSAADIMFSWILMVAGFMQDENVLANEVVAAYAKRIGKRETYKVLYAPPSN